MNYTEPTLHSVDVREGKLEQPSGSYEKRLSDLDGIYADIEAGDLDAALKSSESLDRKVREIDRKYQHVVLHTGWRVGTHPGPIPLL